MKYIKKGAVVDAVQYTGHNGSFLLEWSGGAVIESPVVEPCASNPSGTYVQIPSANLTAPTGAWIIRSGDAYVVMPNAEFLESYEPA